MTKLQWLFNNKDKLISAERRMWDATTFNFVNGCLECNLGVNEAGYSTISFGRGTGTIRGHRLSLSLFLNRPIDDGVVVMHICDNPLCINPLHLKEGTNGENMEDMRLKGRAKFPPIRKGINHFQTKFIPGDIEKIINDNRKLDIIAKDYNVSITTISRVKNKKRYGN